MTPAVAPTDDSSIDQHLAYYATTRPEIVAVWCSRFAWTYGELEHQVARYATLITDQGIEQGDVIAVFANSRPECLVIFLACCRTGSALPGTQPEVQAARAGVRLRRRPA